MGFKKGDIVKHNDILPGMNQEDRWVIYSDKEDSGQVSGLVYGDETFMVLLAVSYIELDLPLMRQEKIKKIIKRMNYDR